MMSTPESITDNEVVAGYDGSEEARKAVRWAAEEAASRGRGLVVVNVVGFAPMPDTAAVAGPWPDPTFLDTGQETAQRHAEALLDDVAQECRRAWPELAVSTRLLSGRAPEELALAAQHAELLVIGSSGLTALPRLLVGSTATELLHDHHRPMVVVRDSQGRSETEDRKVVIGVDGSDAGADAIGFAYDFADRHRCVLVAVHAWSDLSLDTIAVNPAAQDLAITQERGLRLLAESLAGHQEHHPDVVVRNVVELDRPARALAEHAEGATLLVVGSHGRGAIRRAILGSVSHAMVHHAPCPVAVVRPHKNQ